MPQSNICMVCGNECKMMCRSGTGICSENCEKKKHETTIKETASGS